MLGAHPLLLGLLRGSQPAPLLLVADGALHASAAYARASAATGFGASGTLFEAAANAPRFVHAAQALLIERAAQNLCANPRFQGGTAGTIGSGGVVPSDMEMTGNTGVTRHVVGFGTEDGIPYADFRWAGTQGNTSINVLGFNTSGGWTCSVGQVFALSLCVRLVGGSLANVNNIRFRVVERNGSTQSSTSPKTVFVPDGSALRGQRRVETHTIASPSTNNARLQLTFSPVANQPFDLTLRVGLPQVEAGSVATSAILPPAGSPGVASRAAGSLLHAPAGGLPAAATVLLDALLPAAAGAERELLAAETADGAAGLAIQATAGAAQLRVLPFPSGSAVTAGGIAAGARFRAALAWDGSGFAVSLNGAAAVSSAAAPPALARLRHGGAASAEALEIRRLELHPARLPDAALAALSSIP
ncbi:MAG: hypothetical protein N2Z67_02810 [Acetobacteraceae bacterium]|nr:hypothetical protein [Acetobacteraceae bacterium]